MPSQALYAINAEQAAFMQGPVSITVGACNARNEPSVVRALGCRVADDFGKVSILLSKVHAASVLADVEATGAIAVVFSWISTHRTIQVKGRDAVVGPIWAGDADTVNRHRAGFSREVMKLGFSQGFIHHLLHCPDSELVAITFSPCAAFDQTPGPKAGQVLRAES